MRVKAIVTEWFQDYKVPSMFIAFPKCSFKCEKDCGKRVCQNSKLARSEDIDVDVKYIINKYLGDPITKAIVCGGLDPIDDFDELFDLIFTLRHTYGCNDTVVVYTGYTPEEIRPEIGALKHLGNIIIKFGRYIPNRPMRYDDVLGVRLSSDNQYAEVVG